MRPKLPADPAAIRIDQPYGKALFEYVLDELEPLIGTGAYALVEAARDLDAWIELQDGEPASERENRRRVRTAATEYADVPALQPTLPHLLALLRAQSPGAVETREVALAAHRLSIWAEAVGAQNTAITFAQLAQEADAGTGAPDPRLAYELGRVAGLHPDHDASAAEWLEWTGLEARRLGRWDVAADAWRALAERAARRGDTRSAATLRRRATRALARGGVEATRRRA